MKLSQTAAESLLAIWLRLGGVVCASAIVAVLMPRGWHVATHAALGLGTFPATPIAEYLARAMSGMCTLYGCLLIALATDVERYLRIIISQAIGLMAITLSGTVVLIGSGMPTWWLAGDLISVFGYSSATIILARATAISARE